MTPGLAHSKHSAAADLGTEALIARIRDSVIGERTAIPGPYGARPLVYADFIASGRALGFLEEAIAQTVLPLYGNTHTETSVTGRETTALREEARQIIAKALGAGPQHAVIFTGTGATAAIDRLVRGMGIEALVRAGQAPVVFVGPYEHHSNDLPWRESGAVIERIGLTATGQIDLEHLSARLGAHPGPGLKIGAFSAASNVTGIRTDLSAVARLLHQHGARFVCDFAAAAPYINMRLHLDGDDPQARIDAIVYSSHKFIGGPGASGVLVAEKSLFTTARPGVTGGGTVSYVTADHHSYVRDLERREEAGTPGIIGDIRAGAVMALKQAVGAPEIERREHALVSAALQQLEQAPGVEVLGPLDHERIGVLSFNITANGRRLHYGFVVALLNDLFGIQARGGCSCAGPYGHDLLGISAQTSRAYEGAIARGHSLMRPGWVRLGYNYFFDAETADYLTQAILFIAENGARFLCDYEVDTVNGIWRHRAGGGTVSASLGAFWAQPERPEARKLHDLARYYDLAQELADARALPDLGRAAVFDPDCEALRDFWMPQDVGAQPAASPASRAVADAQRAKA
ncbi:aminotransferase class V-fold PLP-dependent enzyme [uncultured Thioclava sp.]|uniref:aminotransferase class V-fold PLP-dependent enzyme n=1 Tax=uncultured Thioclava sp. TaxID=473858 RepID=UPI0025F68F99|nr:aminotransferase class V-fold PLP-dependent enzyme [uncultured Thioclava sp.]